MIKIEGTERVEALKQFGWEFADGVVTLAYMDGHRGVIMQNDAKFYPVVPLNGWRARDLAEEVFGRREEAEMYIGRTFITLAKVLQELPGWDNKHQAIVDSYEGAVYVQIVMYDPSYARYARIVQA